MSLEIVRHVRKYQQPLHKFMVEGGKRAIQIAHRRWGKDEIALSVTCELAHKRIGNYGHCLPEYAQARKAIWKSVNPHTGKRRVDEAFPPEIRKSINDTEMFIELKCGSTWQVLGSDSYDRLVGTSFAGMVFSEWALANPSAWGYVQPILNENNGWALFITTPRGRNHAKRMLDTGQRDDRWYSDVSRANETGVFDEQALKDALTDLEAVYGADIAESMFDQEYMCSFSAAVLGAYYGREMVKAWTEKRINPNVEYDKSLPVHRAWDFGVSDSTVIWWFQVTQTEIRIVDYYIAHGQGLDHYAEVIQGKDYPPGKDYVPHDVRVRELGAPGARSRVQTMQLLGLKPVKVANHKVQDGINAARRTLPRCWFHSERCEEGIAALEEYHREWDDEKKTFVNAPKHNWASHGADAFRILAMCWREVSREIEPKPKPIGLLQDMTYQELLDFHGQSDQYERI